VYYKNLNQLNVTIRRLLVRDKDTCTLLQSIHHARMHCQIILAVDSLVQIKRYLSSHHDYDIYNGLYVITFRCQVTPSSGPIEGIAVIFILGKRIFNISFQRKLFCSLFLKELA
jgi:hypothetical protein